jgi:hypothetical protein
MLVYERPVEIWRDFVPNDAVLAVATSEYTAAKAKQTGKAKEAEKRVLYL